MTDQLISLKNETADLKLKNQMLLSELEIAYKNMETVLEQTALEKEITYKELQSRYNALEKLYKELSDKENMLVHMEKLSSIGQFITEIVHELNNPLTVISGITELLLLKDIPEDIRKKIDMIPEQVVRMTNYLKRFKSMAYKGEEDFSVFDINENVKDFLGTISIIKPKDIQIESELFKEILPVKGDPYQVTQIYLNLAKNAFDAMHDKGDSILIKTTKISFKEVFSEKISKIMCQDPEKWQKIADDYKEFALIEFTDNGPGIKRDILDNVFTAFFTTKGRLKGTGLGLSISTDITTRHHGNLTVKSTAGSGTTFQLILPLTSLKALGD